MTERFIPAAASLLLAAQVCGAAIDIDDVPQFKLRARVTAVDGDAPAADTRFTFGLSGVKGGATAVGNAWSDDLLFDLDAVITSVKAYPNLYLKRYPIVTKMSVRPADRDLDVEAQLRWVTPEEPELDTTLLDNDAEDLPILEEPPPDVTLHGELFGSSLGILVWRDNETQPLAASMADYNQRYWRHLEGVAVPDAMRPRKFPIVDRFIGGDADKRAWREGIVNLSRAGFSAIMLPPSARHREILLETGLRRTSWAVYNPPGYAFDYSEAITDESIREWARKQAQPYLDAGYAAEDMAMYTISDEPGWYFPKMYQTVDDSAEGMQRFREYLRAQGIEPADVGASDWSEVHPIGRSRAEALTANRLFYWSTRFVAWDSTRHFAACTRAMEQAFYPGVPMPVNWNFFSGRFYFPGPFGHNPDKTSPDCAMGSHDWFEFGRMRGSTILWTEDWFGDGRAWQWSFYCSKLNSAARKSGIDFGGYVIPRTCGAREDGILQRILAVVGSGGKALKYFVFGPEYNFPGNCYSFKARLLPKMAEAHMMIGAAEELLWPGRRPAAEVAILHPRSALLWDALGEEIPTGIVDATNVAPERNTVDYMAEVFGLYLALQHANVPVDWLEEEDLASSTLDGYKVLYLTAPDLPVEALRGVTAWVRRGGVLTTVTGAGTYDRYHQPTRVLTDAAGVHEQSRERLLVADTMALPAAGTGTLENAEFVAVGVRARGAFDGHDTIAEFLDGAPAVTAREVGDGRVVHFSWMPGMSYRASGNTQTNGLPAGFSDTIRRLILHPLQAASVQPPVTVDVPLVETPLLVSKQGAALTLLNWTGVDQQALTVTVRLPFAAREAVAVKEGPLPFLEEGGAVRFTLPLRAADIVLLKP